MEKALTLELEEEQLLSILHLPQTHLKTGVLIVVGGPQYRLGSHRQFLQLSRYLATQGIASMRFDYRGMGDSEGTKQTFDSICKDIKTACDAFVQHADIKDVVIWGLCDAASAAMIYAHQDPRIKGLILLNPWLRNEASMGKTMVKHYYLKRLFSKDFWQKLLTGKVNVSSSLSDAKGFVQDSVGQTSLQAGAYQQRMEKNLARFSGKVCLILSGADLTAKEFEEQALKQKKWQKLKDQDTQIIRVAGADHTFSSSEFKREAEEISAKFVFDLGH